MNEILEEYKVYLKRQKMTENTMQSYMRDMKLYFSYLKENKVKNAFGVRRNIINSYVENLRGQGKAHSTVSRYATSLKKFYQWGIKKKFIEENPADGIDLPRAAKKIPEALSTREVVKLLNQPKTTGLKGIRDKAMLELLYATGIKVSEIISISLKDIDIRGGMLFCTTSKNERYIPFGKEAASALDEYIKKARPYMVRDIRVRNLFVNCSGTPMTRQGFWKILRSYAESAGIKTELNAQTLRNSFAVHLLQNGADINAVSEMLGHNDVVTTKVYNQVLKNNIKKIYKKAHPRA